MRINPQQIIKEFKKLRDANLVGQSLGIHRSTVYRWLKRAKTWRGGLRVRVKRKNTRPKRINYVLDGRERLAIEQLRLKRSYGAVKIKYMLQLKCSPMTIQRFLRKKGLISLYHYHRRPKFQDTIHMHASNTKSVGYLQMDVKYITPQLSGLPWTCFEYAIIDIFSRYKEAIILNQLDQDGSIVALLEILPKLPFKPIFIQTDNGLEFQERFKQSCKDMGLKYHYVHKSSPNENAIIERSFRTDEEEFFFRMEKRPKHYDELREEFAKYLHYYNNERPHLGINLKTPQEVVANVVLH